MSLKEAGADGWGKLLSGFEFKKQSSSRRGGGNVEIAQRFPRWVRNPQGFAATVISTALAAASFIFPEAGRPQLLEEFALGLLHTLGGFGIAEGRGDAL